MRHDNRSGGGRGAYQHDRPQTNYSAMTNYYDGNGRLKREVFVDWPHVIAKSVGISRTNMRRVYDYVVAMNFRLRMGETAEDVLQPGIWGLHRFAEYQASRDARNWSEAKKFIQANCERVGVSAKEFEGFYQLFQSTMAYLRSR